MRHRADSNTRSIIRRILKATLKPRYRGFDVLFSAGMRRARRPRRRPTARSVHRASLTSRACAPCPGPAIPTCARSHSMRPVSALPPFALYTRQRPPRRTQTDCRLAVALACALWSAALLIRSALQSICDGLQRRCASRDLLFNFNIGNWNAASTHRKQRRLRQRSKGRRPRFPMLS